jgi:uncharacterized protein
MTGETNLGILISTMKPRLNEGQFVFCTIPEKDIDTSKIICFFRESEGLTLICSKEYADSQGFMYGSTFAWITLQIHSSLDAVGLTAAFSGALAQHNISCNVVAAFYHDHIFVPFDKQNKAIKVLETLAQIVRK